MVHANRLMVEYMTREGMNYPLHLGVTEAGEGEEGRIRSAVGIGTLLWEGTGDTIRVSLTEDPEKEVPVARKLLEHIERQQAGSSAVNNVADKEITLQNRLIRRESRPVPGIDIDYVPTPRIGGDNVPVVISSSTTPGPDYIFSSEISELGGYPLIKAGNYLEGDFDTTDMIFVQASVADLSGELLQKASWDKRVVFVAVSLSPNPLQEMRQFLLYLSESGCGNPVIFKKDYNSSSAEDFQIAASADFAPFFIERTGDGLWLDYLPQDVSHEHSGSLDPEAYSGSGTPSAFDHGPGEPGPGVPGTVDPGTSPPSDLSATAVSTAFSILQSTRTRISKTEFISCPSCGRTMFNIQKATAAVKRRTSHLRGLKIAVMGCIVNGPGEMIDADYGYVGSGRGKVTLYKKQTVIRRNVPEENALDELVGLIKESGDWMEES
jgi:(E)-4-hydroxy-3-methylbut-2-enyl-diphosphate synthase